MNNISPIELCPCQSGKKYEDCCMLKIKIEDNEESKKTFQAYCIEAYKNASMQYCIHPQKDECSFEIVGAHNMQHNGILNQLAVNGHVYMPISDIYTSRLSLVRRGISKQATVFTGFCGKHDKKIFSNIEDYPFYQTKEQLFLYAYKAFAFTYYKILRECKRDELIFAKYDLSSYIQILLNMETHKLYRKFINYELSNFNDCLLTRKYDKIHHIIGKLDYEVSFAVSSAFEAHYDLMENMITHFPLEGKFSLLYLTVFPEKNTSYYLISYFEENEVNYSGLIKQIKSIPRHLLLRYLNNLIILNAENLVISPRLYEHWSKSQRMDFENTLQISIENVFNDKFCDNYFASRSFDIFENI